MEFRVSSMKRKDEAKQRLSSSRCMLDQIPLDLKMGTLTRLPAKLFLMKIHQKKLLYRVKREEGDGNEDDEKDKSPSKLGLIPLDLEVEILTRLPGKSLMKFRCVSKTWSSVTRSQRFVDSFFSMSSMRSRFLIAFSNGVFAKDDAKRLFIFSSSPEGEESSSVVANFDMAIPSVSLAHGSKCVSVHGFVGFRNSAQFIVCNPSTGQVITVPCRSGRTSLGYDPVDDQFKALTLVSCPQQDHDFLVHEVITLGGGESSWRRNKVTTQPYFPVTEGLCINGFVYYGAWAPRQRMDPVIVCFDVRYERLSFIKAPKDVVVFEGDSIFIEYKGKLASIVRYPLSFTSFDLWILEDVKKHEWSKQTFELPCTLVNMTSPGTNKAGEIIFAPNSLSRNVEPFYIFYYNVERKDFRRVMLQGIADSEEFRCRYALVDKCCVSISAEHVENIASL